MLPVRLLHLHRRFPHAGSACSPKSCNLAQALAQDDFCIPRRTARPDRTELTRQIFPTHPIPETLIAQLGEVLASMADGRSLCVVYQVP